jgi:hypothetical protein
MKVHGTILTVVVVICLVATSVAAPSEKKIKIEGVVIGKVAQGVVISDLKGKQTLVRYDSNTQFEEKRKNFMRDPLVFGERDVVRGLKVEVRGWPLSKDSVRAKKVRFTKHDLVFAQAMEPNFGMIDEELVALAEETGLLNGQVGELSEQSRRNRSSADNALANQGCGE